MPKPKANSFGNVTVCSITENGNIYANIWKTVCVLDWYVTLLDGCLRLLVRVSLWMIPAVVGCLYSSLVMSQLLGDNFRQMSLQFLDDCFRLISSNPRPML